MSDQYSLESRRRVIGQVLVCTGCCCGRVERGNPAVPVDWLKRQWRNLGLLKHLHLTISGCLGPCDLVNVVAIVGPTATTWLGGLDHQDHFAALLDWAVHSVRDNVLVELPLLLADCQFERFK